MKYKVATNGENAFIEGVVKSCLMNDQSKKHFLIEGPGGVTRYEAFVDNPIHPVTTIKYEDGTEPKVVCTVGREIIEQVHESSGKGDLAKRRVEKYIRDLIQFSKQFSRLVYNEPVSEKYKGLQKDVHKALKREAREENYSESDFDRDIFNILEKFDNVNSTRK